jgi:hypothetical protein
MEQSEHNSMSELTPAHSFRRKLRGLIHAYNLHLFVL